MSVFIVGAKQGSNLLGWYHAFTIVHCIQHLHKNKLIFTLPSFRSVQESHIKNIISCTIISSRFTTPFFYTLMLLVSDKQLARCSAYPVALSIVQTSVCCRAVRIELLKNRAPTSV